MSGKSGKREAVAVVSTDAALMVLTSSYYPLPVRVSGRLPVYIKGTCYAEKRATVVVRIHHHSTQGLRSNDPNAPMYVSVSFLLGLNPGDTITGSTISFITEASKRY